MDAVHSDISFSLGKKRSLSFRHVANERGSILVISNLKFAEWTEVFGQAVLKADLLERLAHRCVIHMFSWESLRFKEIIKRSKKSEKSVNTQLPSLLLLVEAEMVIIQKRAPF